MSHNEIFNSGYARLKAVDRDFTDTDSYNIQTFC